MVLRTGALRRAAATVCLVLVCHPHARGQTRLADRPIAAKAIRCTFSTQSTASWNSLGPAAQTKPATLSLSFADINPDEGTATADGASAPAEIIARASQGILHFIQAFRDGPLYVTTVFPFEARAGFLVAVHTRHAYTQVAIPGYTSRPEQYYGECAIEAAVPAR